MANAEISALVRHAVRCGLISREDSLCAANRLLEAMRLDEYEPAEPASGTLAELLDALTADAVRRGVCEDNIVARDLFDTKLMGALTPWPREVSSRFRALYELSPETATDWFYRFCQDTNYIRRDRIARDVKWPYPSEYGDARHHDQPLEAREGPEGHRRRAAGAAGGLPQVPALRRKRGLRGAAQPPGAAEPAPHPAESGRRELVFPVFALRLLQRALHRFSSEHRPMKVTRAAFDRCWTSRGSSRTTLWARTPTCPSWAAPF
jgi:UDPglucose--hexose-1-phosphate uridylyltransferase